MSVNLFEGGTRGFADIGPAIGSNGFSAAMYFPRRQINSEEEMYDLYDQLAPSINPSASVAGAYLHPPDATLTIEVPMVGLSDFLGSPGGGVASVGEGPGSGASYAITVWWNPAGSAGNRSMSFSVPDTWSPIDWRSSG